MEDKSDIFIVVITNNGLPFFYYPSLDFLKKSGTQTDETLFSGFLQALIGFGTEIIGSDVKEMVFSNLYMTLTSDTEAEHKQNNDDSFIYVVGFTKKPKQLSLIKTMHMEFISLFKESILPLLKKNKINNLINLNLMNTSEDAKSIQKNDELKKHIDLLMKPFLSVWHEKLNL